MTGMEKYDPEQARDEAGRWTDDANLTSEGSLKDPPFGDALTSTPPTASTDAPEIPAEATGPQQDVPKAPKAKERPVVVPEPAKAVKTPTGTLPDAPVDGANFVWAKTKGGSVPGGVYVDTKTNKKYLVKFYPDTAQASVEVATNLLYNSVGLDAPRSHAVDNIDFHGKKRFGVANEWIEGLEEGSKQGTMKAKDDVSLGFATDALLANWDVFGMSYDNIAFVDGKPMRVDNGGSMTYRAQGSKKTYPSDRVDELTTFLDPSRKSSVVFSPIKTNPDIKRRSYDLAASITDDAIDHAIGSAGFDKTGWSEGKINDLKATVKGRRDVIAAKAKALAKASLAKAEVEDEDEEQVAAPQIKLTEDQIREAITTPLGTAMQHAMAKGLRDGGKQMESTLRVKFREEDKDVTAFLKEHATNLEHVLDESTVKIVRDALAAGYKNAETEKQIIGRIQDSGAFSDARAQRIARTEGHISVMNGVQAAMKQAGVTKRQWLSAPDARDTHQDANGQIRPIDEPFEVGEALLMYPGDPDGGLDHPEETINCFLPGAVISGVVVAGSKFRYRGKAIEITTASGRRLAVTPNHPVLTDAGLLPAASLREGFRVVGNRAEVECRTARVGDDEQDGPPLIEDVFESMATASAARMTPIADNDFHGDGRGGNGDVQVVRTNRPLFLGVDPALAQDGGEGCLEHPLVGCSQESRSGACYSRFQRVSAPASRDPSGTALSSDGVRVTDDAAPLRSLGFGTPAKLHAALLQRASEGIPADAAFVRQLLEARPSQVSLDEIVNVREFEFLGQVYDIQTNHGLILANGIITSNCRCVTLSMYDDDETTADDIVEALDPEGDEDAVDRVKEIAGELPDHVVSRIDPEDIHGIAAYTIAGSEVQYDPDEKAVLIGDEADDDDVEEAIKEHLVGSLVTDVDARNFENLLNLYELPKPIGQQGEYGRAVAGITLAVNGDRAGLEAVVGRPLTNAEWRQYQTIAQQFWISPAVGGTKPDIREPLDKHTPGGVDHDQSTHGSRGGASGHGVRGRAPKIIDHVEGMSHDTLFDNLQGDTKDQNAPLKPERAKLHKGIYEKVLGSVKPVAKGTAPRAILMMGGPASGKSTLIKDLSESFGENNALVIDADSMKRELPEYKEARNANAVDAASIVHKESRRMTRDLLDAATKKGEQRNVIWDGTGANAQEYIGLVSKLEKQGYDVSLHYVEVDRKTAHERAQARARVDGRVVPADAIDYVYDRVPENFHRLSNHVNHVTAWSNRGDGPVLSIEIKNGRNIIHDRKTAENILKRKA